jgi:cell division protein FtsQ
MDRGGRFVRPVTQERKSPKARGQSGRTPSRGITRGPAPRPNRRGKSGSGLLARTGRFLRALLNVRRPMFWITLVLGSLFAGAVMLSNKSFTHAEQKTDSAAGTLASNAGFGIAQVHLAGNQRTTPAAIMAALNLQAGQPIFGVNLRAARALLMQLPWVADAEVTRRYPDDIDVRIIERIPYARWQEASGLYVVERNGRPITRDGAETFVKLPLLIGDGAPQAAEAFVNAVRAHHAIEVRVGAFQYVGQRRWNLLLDDGVIVKLPEDGWQKQLSDLDHLVVDKGILERDVREIDLRHPSYYFFKFRNGSEQNEKKTATGSAI